MAEPGSDDDILISQEDIDNLLNASSFDGVESLLDDGEDVSDAEMEALSQDDIDNLLNTSSVDFDSSEDQGVSDFDDDDDDLELVSQEDIDRLMNAATAEGTAAIVPPGDGEIRDGATVETDPGTAREMSLDGEDVIDESQALSIAENLITQETIDRLLAGEPESEAQSGPEPEQMPGPDPVFESEPESDLGIEPFPEPEPEPEFEPEFEPESEPESEFEFESDLVSGAPVESGDDTIAQADIDDLLRDDLPEEDSDENDLISQDDIDELLRSSEEEDEDIIGALDTPTAAAPDVDGDGNLPVEEDHQVVLEEAKEPAAPTVESAPDAPVPVRKWYRSKKLMAACLGAVLVMAALPVAYFTFFGKKEPRVIPGPRQVTEIPETVAPDVVTVHVDLPREDEVLSGSGNMVLEDFVVLVPSGEAGFVYVTAGVSIDYTDARAATEINNHLPLYRDIIFEAMGQALASEKIDKITEVDLLAKIKEALNRSLPGRYVEQVQFKAFSTG